MGRSPSGFRVRRAVLWGVFGAFLVLAGSVSGGFTSQRRWAPSVDTSSGTRTVAGKVKLSVPEAVAGNRLASTELRWLFGGKAQRGWAIYIPLIRETVGSDKNEESAEFAKAVARWQSDRGLRATGVVDNETWWQMIRQFQARRIRDRKIPSSHELVIVPASEFYDNGRPDELRQVERNAYAAYKRMLAAAAKERSLGLRVNAAGALDPAEKYLKIISSFRSREHQDRLRKAEPGAGRAGLAVNSPHQTGRRLPLCRRGAGDTKDGNRLVQTRTAVYGGWSSTLESSVSAPTSMNRGTGIVAGTQYFTA